MSTSEAAEKRLEEDLNILAAMATVMTPYLDSTAVYYPLAHSTFPRLTLGSYLMRQHRLLAVRDELSTTEDGKLETAVSKAEQAIGERVVRVEQKGEEEVRIRLRQWKQTVKELRERTEQEAPYYATTVENRVILAALLHYLQHKTYRFDVSLQGDTGAVDQKLHAIWQSGPFVWPDVWEPAYDEDVYWWLYGRPLSTAIVP